LAKQLRLDVAQLTDVGRKREHNEDNMAYHIPPEEEVMVQKGALFIVADGMGGHAAGEVASEIAVDTISDTYYQDNDDDVAASLLHAIKRANASIHQRAAENMLRSGMGTTCVTAVLRGDMAYIANVGDSRAYLVRGGNVKQVSQDHSWVAEQVRAGLLSEDQARTHAQRNVITRCLGTQSDVEIDVFTERLQEGDSLVLCTDGLSGLISDEDLRTIVSQFVPQESVYHLVERANENGGPDNITAIVVRVQEVGIEPDGRHPAFIGGRETSEDARVSGGLSTIPPGLIPQPRGSGPLRESSPTMNRGGPITSSSIPRSDTADSDTLPQPLVKIPRRRHGRLFYTTVAMLILLLIGMVGGGAYYVLGVRPFPSIQALIMKAQAEAANNPTLALHDLSSAQQMLQAVPDTPLNHTQRSQLSQQLTTTVQAAINSYNTHNAITSLCSKMASSAPVSNGSTGTQAQRLVVVQQGNGASFRYALGQDNKLYQLNPQNSLTNPLIVPSSVQVADVVGDDTRLAVLVKGMKTPNYFLDLVIPNKNGLLQVTDSDGISLPKGQLPTLLAAQSTDVYVLLVPPSTTTTTAQIQGQVFDYTVGSNNTLNPLLTSTTFTIPRPIVSMAAFPNHLLFLLLDDGSVMSLQLGGTAAVQTTTSVQLSQPLASPLTTSGTSFNTTAVPTVSPQFASTGPISLQLGSPRDLSVGSLASAVIGGVPHLYLADATQHRVLDLSGVPTPLNGATSNGSKRLLFRTVQQYASESLLAQVKGLTVDTREMVLYALTQTSSTMMNLLSIKLNASVESNCS
jgi:serine/threonine protein phosphatase PrpC